MAASHVTRVRVRYAETDAMKVMHHAVWPVYWELGRTDLLRARTRSYAVLENEDGILFPVIGFGVEIFAPARHDDEIEIRSSVTELGRVKIRFAYEGWLDGRCLAKGYSQHGIVDRDWKPTRLPREVALHLRPA
jgi:acyl-CoA thioester hydrolase